VANGLLVVALHGVHSGGFDGGWIGPIVLVVLIILALALASRNTKK